MQLAIVIIQALAAGIPRIVELIRQGREPGGIKLEEVISTDALSKLEQARDDAQNFIDNG